jgi:hypothetical protein
VWSATAKQYVAGLAFHEKAFAVVYGKLDTPDKGVIEAYSDNDPETGCNMRYMMYLDGDNDQWKVRWDILFGFGGLYPEWASRHPRQSISRLDFSAGAEIPRTPGTQTLILAF